MIIDVDSDRFVREVIEGNEYSFLFQDLVVVDLGCNIGSFTLWIHKLGSIIHSVDMVPEVIQSLGKTISDNKLQNIFTHCIGITGKSEKRRYKKDNVLGGGGSIIGDEGDSITPCMSFGEFMKSNNIGHVDILKVDVEGAEYDIFSAPDFPKDKVFTIIGEFHPSGRNRSDLGLILTRLGYRYFEYPNNHFKALR